jgi:murein DD-endopeptidase MepM/ murein hydrolase activator NlpD
MQEDALPQSLRRLRGAFSRNFTRKKIVICSAGLAAAIATSTLLFENRSRLAASPIFAQAEFSSPLETPQNTRWGFALDHFNIFEDKFEKGDILGKILAQQGLSAQEIDQMVKNSKGVFNIAHLQTGRNFTMLSTQPNYAEWLIYEPNAYEFVTFQLKSPFAVELHKRNVTTEMRTASGVLESSFWQAMTDNGLSDEVADKMIDILAASVDFYHQKAGDRFKVVFEQHIVEGKEVGTGRVLAAVYERDGKPAYAFRFENSVENKTDYYDADGRPARKAFLKTPVKYSRISSGFSMKRFHPILHYNRPHFGTDYAAPYGTPVLAVADGTIQEATRRGGNGNFVKIKHDKTYETQYLHLQGFAKGIRPGTHVAQGQVIGYVGSTGLATGPHCCFRFWKNGQQVNWLNLNLPNADPMKGKALELFQTEKNRLTALLNGVQYRTQSEIFAENAVKSGKAKP